VQADPGAGYRLRFLPSASAAQLLGQEHVQRPISMLREAYRSRIHYFEKHFPGWGGSLTRGVSIGEMMVRRAVFTLMAYLSSRNRQALQERAESSAACLQTLRAADVLAADRPSNIGAGYVLFFVMLVVFSVSSDTSMTRQD